MPGQALVPASANPMEMLNGQIVYQGTVAEPIICYED